MSRIIVVDRSWAPGELTERKLGGTRRSSAEAWCANLCQSEKGEAGEGSMEDGLRLEADGHGGVWIMRVGNKGGDG